MRLSIRLRLTLWYTAAVALLLAILAVSLIVVYDRIALARLETDLRRINDAVAAVLTNELVEKGHQQAAAEEALIEVVVPGRHLAIATRDGHMLATRWKLESTPPVDATASGERIVTLTAPTRATAIVRSLPPVPSGFVVIAAASWDELSRDRANLLRSLAIVIPAALVVTAFGAWWVAGRALRPARIMAAEASRFTGDTRGQRLTIDRQDELGQLGTAFNGVVDRLESALLVRTQFLADASHELRTPVSISKTAAEVALSREGRTEAEYRDALEVIARQQTHLGRIVSDMLTLARSEATDWPIAPTDFYLDELVGEAVDALGGLAAEGGVQTWVETPAELRIRGDESLLRQMIVNLVENAIRHTPAGGTVRVKVTAAAPAAGMASAATATANATATSPISALDAAAPGDVVIAVEDTGHGIPEADRDRVFERFVRVSNGASPAGAAGQAGAGAEANGHHAPGTGLGLAIARRVARAHGGDVRLVSTGPSGTHFAATLPHVLSR